MEIDRLLKIMVEKHASDLFITTGVPPSIKINGKVVPVTTTKLTPEKCRETVLSVMTDELLDMINLFWQELDIFHKC